MTDRRRPRLPETRKGRVVVGLTVITVVGLVYLFWVASHAYSQAGRYFEHVAYIQECTGSGPKLASVADCAKLSSATPNYPDGIPLHDPSTLLALGQGLDQTGVGIYTLAGLWVATWGVVITGISVAWKDTAGPRAARVVDSPTELIEPASI
jgi:hypothetical protein